MKVLSKVFLLLISALEYIYPKNNRLWVFSDRNGGKELDGNSSALFKYLSGNCTDISAYILTDNMAKTKNEGYLYYLSLKGIVIFCKAKVAFFHHGPYDFGYISFDKRKEKVHLNHGIHFKRLGYTLKGYKSNYFSTRRFIPHHMCSSDVDALAACAHYHIDFENAHVTGLARNDVLSQNSTEQISVKDQTLLDHLSNGKRLILYAPTWRENGCNYEFTQNFVKDIELFCKEQNWIFIYGGHPLITNRRVPDSEYFIDIDDIDTDIQVLMRYVDCLVTDYSSIWIDYLLVSKPIIGFWWDSDDYLNNRGLIYDLVNIFPGEIAENEKELVTLLKDISENKIKINDKYRASFELFHRFSDGKSSKRIVEKVKSII